MAAVLREALELLARRGAVGLSFEEIANTVGINKTSIYRRWPTRSALIVAALRSLPGRGERIPDSGSTADDLVEVLLHAANAAGSRRSRNLSSAMLTLDSREAASVTAAGRGESRATLERIVLRGKDRGEVPRRIDAAFVAKVLLCVVLHQTLMLREKPDRAFIRQLVELALTGRRGRGASMRRRLH